MQNIVSSKSKRVFTLEKNSLSEPPYKRLKMQSIQKTETVTSKSTMSHTFKSEDQKLLKSSYIPLAEKMRPLSLSQYVGQKHILDYGTVLYQLLEKNEIPSMILWGPPGCGKTTLAIIIAGLNNQEGESKATRFVKLSATSSGIGDIKEAVNEAKNEVKFGRQTIIFMDEIHRFNKLQQDIFLPHVEAGTITLIGATTENPSFSLNSALLSRCRVFVLEKLASTELISILQKAIVLMNGKIYDPSNSVNLESLKTNVPEHINFLIDIQNIEWLANACDGNARVALGGLELAIQCKMMSNTASQSQNSQTITLEDIKRSLMRYQTVTDKRGDNCQDLISALQKSIRAGEANASLYWLARVMAAEEDPVCIARRLIRIATEDVGIIDPDALGIAVNTMHGCHMIGMPECDVLLTQCVVYLAKSQKSRIVDNALRAAQQLVQNQKGPQPSVPHHIRYKSEEGKLMAKFNAKRFYSKVR
ncbi:ATPase WRNIP1 isoform X3 [Cephus cinctus]|uniref:ATPase WRNIP1 isoform X3 n=1 Tax=Cephus cinctus TaxID=211228 RepID=A0AAJ7BFE7_CEPCN|nr:ATPase WRNIP1 isoform X3 [Cephus cinctus]